MCVCGSLSQIVHGYVYRIKVEYRDQISLLVSNSTALCNTFPGIYKFFNELQCGCRVEEFNRREHLEGRKELVKRWMHDIIMDFFLYLHSKIMIYSLV